MIKCYKEKKSAVREQVNWGGATFKVVTFNATCNLNFDKCFQIFLSKALLACLLIIFSQYYYEVSQCKLIPFLPSFLPSIYPFFPVL